MPELFSYQITAPKTERMLYTDQILDPMLYIRKKVTEFNIHHINDTRIFSSSQDSGTFLTAFQLDDTLSIFDIGQYEDRDITACQIHMRWPTSRGRGLWWGPQPIALGNLSGTHNGHLSSDKSNAIALEQIGIPLNVGTDSEAIFKLLHYLVENNYSLKEIEWILCRKFPKEAELMEEKERDSYHKLTSNPILDRFKFSGPTTAIVLIGDLLIGLTDRDHLRAFTIGYNDKVTFMASEERAVVMAAYTLGEDIEIFNPDAGKVVAFDINNGIPKRLDYEWKKAS
jgi:glutamate synthase domain-containing protein 1